MPDRRTHRGAHPEDARLFAPAHHPTFRRAMEEYAYLLSREYAEPPARGIVGNHHNLTQRQRMAMRRSCCSDQSLAHRRRTSVSLDRCKPGPIGIDGYNLLITIESALSHGLILIGRDGCYRDLASVHGTYRRVSETLPAIKLIADHLAQAGIERVDWYLDRPVSNSGRLKVLIAETLSGGENRWNIELVDNPDAVLAKFPGPVVSTDAWVLDRCAAWVSVAGEIIRTHLPESWIVDMRP